MNVVRIRHKLESDTPHLPELRPLVGSTVEMIVFAVEPPTAVNATPGTGDWEAIVRAAEQLRASGYDFDAWQRQREFDLQVAKENLP